MAVSEETPQFEPLLYKHEEEELWVTTPTWFAWQTAMERAVRPQGGIDSQRLMEEVLLASMRDCSGQPLTRQAVQGWSSSQGDRLLTAVLDRIDEMRAQYAFQWKDDKDGVRHLHGKGVELVMRKWTFGERNDCLRRCLHVQQGQVQLDLAAYELMMILVCVTQERGEALQPSEVSRWPVPLGEQVLEALDQLNGVEKNYDEVLSLCIETGHSHPDLTMIRLCQAFGWQPEQVRQMDADLVERLDIGLQHLEKTAQPSLIANRTKARGERPPHHIPAAVQPWYGYANGEGVTRIIVTEE